MVSPACSPACGSIGAGRRADPPGPITLSPLAVGRRPLRDRRRAVQHRCPSASIQALYDEELQRAGALAPLGGHNGTAPDAGIPDRPRERAALDATR